MTSVVKRRGFVTGTVALLVAPLAARAQPAGRLYQIAFLSGTTVPELVEALRRGLREVGWIEGRHFVLEQRSAESKFETIPALATDLIHRKVDVIVVSATAIPYLKQATGNVPVVFVVADDPVGAGYVASLARPGGRMTGLTSLNVNLDAKRLEILKAALPTLDRVGVLSSPDDPSSRERVAAAEAGARSLGLQLRMFEVSRTNLLVTAFDAASRAHLSAMMVLGSPIFRTYQGPIVDLARRARMPVISAWRDLPDAGGLMSYGTSVPAMFRRAATYVDRIIKGANPGDLPVEQASTFELVINLKAAKALNLTIPPSVLARADQVIE
jgi:putative tryptophan/tyrosine transport system substrate-binding protein